LFLFDCSVNISLALTMRFITAAIFLLLLPLIVSGVELLNEQFDTYPTYFTYGDDGGGGDITASVNDGKLYLVTNGLPESTENKIEISYSINPVDTSGILYFTVKASNTVPVANGGTYDDDGDLEPLNLAEVGISFNNFDGDGLVTLENQNGTKRIRYSGSLYGDAYVDVDNFDELYLRLSYNYNTSYFKTYYSNDGSNFTELSEIYAPQPSNNFDICLEAESRNVAFNLEEVYFDNFVISDSPEYTANNTSEEEDDLSDSRLAGQNDVTSDPNTFNLYSESDLSTAQSSSRTLGQQDVITSPLSFGLYSPSYVISLLDSSRAAGHSDVIADPSSYGLKPLNPPDVYVVNDIAEDTTWASDITYFLDGVISIMPGVTLNIEPGTVIRGLHSGETTNGDLSILFVLPGAKLAAKGTEENPIIFTNNDDTLVDINPYNPGDRDQPEDNDTSAKKSTDDQNLKRWGGIYILGNAFVDEIGTHPYYYLDPIIPGEYFRQDGPLEPMGLIKEIISLLGESPYPLERTYDTNDDSGDLEFISIRYTGDTKVYSPDRGDRNLVMQPNGLTLYGVGNGTDISNIEVYNAGDDAFNFHGGSVQPLKLAGIIFGDECFEFNFGWSGQINKIFGYGTEYSSEFLEVKSYPNGSPTMNRSSTVISFASYINNSTYFRSIAIKDGAILELLNSYISSSYTDTFYRLYGDGLSVSGGTNAYLTSYPTMEGLPNTFINAYINDFEKTKSLRATHGAFANADIWTQWMVGHKFLINNCSEYVALSMPQDSALGDSDFDGIPDVDDLHTGFNDRNLEFYIQNNAPSNYKTLEEFNTVVAERDAKLTLNEVADLRTGSAMIEVSNNQATIQIQMEESSDLESWTETGDATTMTVPADTDTKFFRFKMME
jgi:hypothetical protein